MLTVALVGLALVAGDAGNVAVASGSKPVLGLAIAVAAGVTYAATTVLGHSLAQSTESVTLTTCATAAGAVLLAPFLFVAANRHEAVFPSHGTSVALLVYLGVVTRALAYGLLYAGLQTTRGSAATVVTLIEPISAALLAALLLGERPGWFAVAGGALILGAMIALRPAEHGPQLA